jgi:tRNA pseudouridine55 synthase
MEPKQGIVTLYKEQGETPLECIERYRSEHPELKDESLSYLGRLDPMAEGVLLVAVGKENKNREKYLGLDKEYEFEVLFGFETDTSDLLGMARFSPALSPSFSTRPSQTREGSRSLRETVPALTGPFPRKLSQKYPPYSSRTVNGKPLWMWAREGKLGEIEIPTIEIEIFDFKELGTRTISKEDLLKEIEAKIAKVKGDFRQAESLESWREALNTRCRTPGVQHLVSYKIGSFWIKCSAGTYVRSLANDMGGVAFKIKRTKVG